MSQFVRYVRKKLKESGNQSVAAAMQKYMKTEQPFYGVKTPIRKRIYREAKELFPINNRKEYEEIITGFWGGQFREEMYQALEVAQNTKKFYSPESWDLYEKMIHTSPNWDTLDWLATRIVGPLILRHRELENKLSEWSESQNFWVRRASLLAHLKHKEKSNICLLSQTILKLAHEDAFFIRKAIGWALREHSYTDPKWVTEFVKNNENTLSALSKREAFKHIKVSKISRTENTSVQN